jgi:hypothetical protein
VASSENPCGPARPARAFVAILAVRTRRLGGDVRTAYSSARVVRARFDYGPGAGRVKFGCESGASRDRPNRCESGEDRVRIECESSADLKGLGPRAATLSAPVGGPRERRMSGTHFDTERATRARVGTEARKNKSASGMRRAV